MVFFELFLIPKIWIIWVEDFRSTSYAQTSLCRGVFSTCDGYVWAEVNSTTGNSRASYCSALLQNPTALGVCFICSVYFPIQWGNLTFICLLQPLFFPIKFLSLSASSPGLTSPPAAGSSCAMPPQGWQGEGEKKSLSFVLQIQRVIIPSLPMDERVKIIVGS